MKLDLFWTMGFLRIAINWYCSLDIAINLYCSLHIAINWYCNVKTNIPSNATAAQTSSIWLREGFKQYDGDWIKFPGGWQFQSAQRRIQTMWPQFEWSSQVDGNSEALGEGFEQCDGNLNWVPRFIAISKHLEKDSNNVTSIQIEFTGGWQIWSALRRIRTMWR